jgi:hypothetical protein
MIDTKPIELITALLIVNIPCIIVLIRAMYIGLKNAQGKWKKRE